jgi:diguanylate cyclase (GGDEF)-like protein/PAS domain S-box-containing protein
VELLLALLRHSSDAVGILEPDGTLRPGPFGFLGYAPDDLAGRFALEFVHPDDTEQVTAHMLDAMAHHGLAPTLEARMRHADGSWRWYVMCADNMVSDPSVRGLVFTGRDVTEQKEAEVEIQRSERRWRKLLHSSAERVTIVAGDGSVLMSTSRGRALSGSQWALDTMSAEVKARLHADDLAAVTKHFARVRRTPGMSPPLLLRLRSADNRWRWAEVIADNQLDDPDVAGIIFTSRDVTGLHEASLALQEETRLLETLHGIGRRLAGELDLGTLLQQVVDAGTEVTGATIGAFFHKGRGDDEEAYPLYATCGVPRHLAASFPSRVPELFYPVFEGAGPLRMDDLRADPRLASTEANPLGVRSFFGVPVVARNGQVHGALFFGHPEPGVFTERGRRLAEGLAAHAAIALENARLYDAAQSELAARRQLEADLVHQAHHDPLTGLPNRALLQDRLGQAIARLDRSARAVAVLLLDLDRFKVVNDSLGHAAGDRILEAVAERLLQTVRPGDTVARLGGDEFVLVCDHINGELDAVGLADRVADGFNHPFHVGDHAFRVSASIGIAMATDPSADPAVLLRDADAVMYRAKARGGGCWEIFDADLRERVVERLRVETDLRRALEADEVALYFQPVVELSNGEVVGAEGLARWEHPDRGTVMPSEFITVAEESGLIVALGEHMLMEGCRQLARWSAEGGGRPRNLAVNVSARQLVQGDLVATVRTALAETGADPTRLCLEITETALMGDVAAAGRVLRRLHELGVQLWVDDFGTGYSSLIYLRRLPLDGLKVDRSFVAGLSTEEEDRVIVSGIVNLAHNLGLVALAEGVETPAQAAWLRALGCDLAQGFLWSPAVRAVVG